MISEERASWDSEAGMKPADYELVTSCFRYKGQAEHILVDLLKEGYVPVLMKSIFLKNHEWFFVKPRFNESPEHLFYIFQIVDFLRYQNIKFRVYTTKKPDIIFLLGKKKIAVEVETGVVLEKSRKKLLQKIEMLNKDYDYWFFVVTKRKYAKRYKKYGKTIDTRYLLNYLKRFVKNYKISHANPQAKKGGCRRKKTRTDKK